MKYFRFDYQIKKSTENPSFFNKMTRCLLFFMPKANPDFEDKYSLVVTWYIEYDDINNYTNREIGLSEDKGIIVKAPFGKNLGFWTDSDVTLEDYEKWNKKSVTSEEFDALWEKSF